MKEFQPTLSQFETQTETVYVFDDGLDSKLNNDAKCPKPSDQISIFNEETFDEEKNDSLANYDLPLPAPVMPLNSHKKSLTESPPSLTPLGDRALQASERIKVPSLVQT